MVGRCNYATFATGLGELPFHDIHKKKRYAFLVIENVGNFQIVYKSGIVVLTFLRGAAISLSVHWVFPTTFNYDTV